MQIFFVFSVTVFLLGIPICLTACLFFSGPMPKNVRTYTPHRHNSHAYLPSPHSDVSPLVGEKGTVHHFLYTAIRSYDLVLHLLHTVCQGCHQKVLWNNCQLMTTDMGCHKRDDIIFVSKSCPSVQKSKSVIPFIFKSETCDLSNFPI